MLKNIWLTAWITAALSLFFYSYTQVDLGLTLTRASFLLDIQRAFQYVGYFNRPLSTYLYGGILLILFVLYIWTLKLVREKKLTRGDIWKTVLIVSAILFLSYNAFSYDLFNFIFDAKIAAFYHENPYEKKALDYPGDPMLGFMRWTHRVYPYGPSWLGVTVPLYFLGGGIFLITFFLFKALMTASFIGCAYFIEKISSKTKTLDSLFALCFFSLSPFVLIEGIVSSHNDIVMMFLALTSIYLLIIKQRVWSSLLFILSATTKFATGFLLPAYLLFLKKKNIEQFLFACLLCMVVPLILVSFRTNFQPWYLLYLMPFAAFFATRGPILLGSVILTFGVELMYIPYLYTGNWDPPIPFILTTILLTSLGIATLSAVGYYFRSIVIVKK